MTKFARGRAFKSAEVDVSADDFYRVLRDWVGVMKWVATGPNAPAPVIGTELKPGHHNDVLPCTRQVFMDTSKGFPPVFEETLIFADSEARRIYYNVEGVVSGGMQNYMATTTVDDIGPGRARVTLSSTFDAPSEDAVKGIQGFLEAVYQLSVIEGITRVVKQEAV